MDEKIRKIIHIDMDAYFSSIEQRDNPELIGKPVIVGGEPNTRSVVATCSYEARKYGIHSAMSCNRAYQLCPKAIFTPPRFEAYWKCTQKIRKIFSEYTDLVEPLSFDEAFLDVTSNKKNIKSATIIAKDIKKKIYKITKLTSSAGVSINKFIAKIASDINKPDGLTVIPPEKVEFFIENLKVSKFFGIGKVTEAKLKRNKIFKGKDLKELDLFEITQLLGKRGKFYYDIVRGIDLRPVISERKRKSLGREITLKEDINNIIKINEILKKISKNVIISLKKEELVARTLTLKIRYSDFKTITRSITLEEYFDDFDVIVKCLNNLLNNIDFRLKKIRLLGISLSNLKEINNYNENINPNILEEL